MTKLPDMFTYSRLMEFSAPDYNPGEALRTDERTGHIPVIMLTGANDFELGRRHTAASLGRELGVRPPEGFVEKPPNTKEFLELLKDILER